MYWFMCVTGFLFVDVLFFTAPSDGAFAQNLLC
jgi:hypothetical protein